MWSLMVLLLISLGNGEKLNRLYLPPPNANLAGGRPGDIQVPKQIFYDQNQDGPPNNVQIVPETTRFFSDISTTPISNDLKIPTDDAIIIKSIPTDDEISNYYTTPGQKLSKNNLPSSTFYENDSDDAIDTLPNSENIIPSKVLESSLPGEVISNEADFSNANPDFLKDKQLKESNERFNNLPSYLSNTENTNENLTPSSLTSHTSSPSTKNYPENFDKSRSQYPNGAITNIKQYPERIQAEADRQAVILNYYNKLYPDSYAYSFDTSNGIHGDENGTTVGGTKAQGSYSYIGDDGKLYNVTYTADENGFRPRGDHLPTSPPIPEAIQKALEKIAENEKKGIFDDGSYDENKYGYRNYGTTGVNNPYLGAKTVFRPPVSLPNADGKYFVTSPKNTLNGESFIQPTSSLNTYNNMVVNGDSEDNYDDLKQFMEPGIIKSGNEQLNFNKRPSNQEISLLQNQNNKLPDLVQPKYSTSPSNILDSHKTRTFSNPSLPNEDSKINVYSISEPITESGYQYFPPTNRFIFKINNFPSVNSNYETNDISEITPSTLLPSTSTAVPQEYFYVRNQLDRSQPNTYNQLISPNELKQNNQNSPKLDVAKNIENIPGENFISDKNGNNYNQNQKNPEGTQFPSQIKVQSSIPYNIDVPASNEDYEVYSPEKAKFGQKNYTPMTLGNFESPYFLTTTIPTQNEFGQRIYNKKFVPGQDGKVLLSTTVEPNLSTSQESVKINQNSPYPITEAIVTQFGNTDEPFILQSTDRPMTDFVINNNFNVDYNPLLKNQGSPNDFYKSQSALKNIGEDFSGPKQPQIYDPITGYHY